MATLIAVKEAIQFKVISINKFLKGNIFKRTFEDEPHEEISYGFGHLNYYSDYKPKKRSKLSMKRLARLERKWNREPLPF
jgi:hypothetical protein